MQHYWDDSVFCSPFEQILSLDKLYDGALDAKEGAVQFDVRDPSLDAAVILEHAETLEAVARFLNVLSKRDQEIVHRIFWLGESQATVATHFHVSRMAVCKALKKALNRGKRELAAYRGCALLQ